MLKILRFLGLFLIFTLGALPLGAEGLEGEKLLNQGFEYFKNNQFDLALVSFRKVIQDPNMEVHYGIAYFMIAKSYMALQKYSDATRNLEYFLLNYPQHTYYSEAFYLKGKLLYHQGDLENAIQVLHIFVDQYPSSPFVPNAYFFIGECLYNLGQFDESLKYYRYVVQKYPISYKVEAAKYRISLIDFKKRENELLKLLQWSYEDSLKLIEEFQQREKTYEQAIIAYQKRLAGEEVETMDEEAMLELQKLLDEKDEEIMRLKSENDELKVQVASLGDLEKYSKLLDEKDEEIMRLKSENDELEMQLMALTDAEELEEKLALKDEEIENLTKENEKLKQQVADLEEASTSTAVSTSDIEAEKAKLARMEELLNLKKRALEVKEIYLQQLESSLEEK